MGGGVSLPGLRGAQGVHQGAAHPGSFRSPAVTGAQEGEHRATIDPDGLQSAVVDERLEHRRGVGHLPGEGQQAVGDDPPQDVGVRRRHRVRGNDGHGCLPFPECLAICLVMVVSLGVAAII